MLVYTFGIILAVLIGNGLAKCQDEPEPTKLDTVGLKADQQLQLDLFSEQAQRAGAEAQVAQLRHENARLKLILAIGQFKTALGLGDEYQWSDEQRKFISTPKATKNNTSTKSNKTQ